MLYSTTVIAVIVVLSIAATYTFGWICYNAGRKFGIKVGYSAGMAVGHQETILSNLKDEACIKLFDEIMGEDTCPVCMDAPVAKGQGACNGCLCDLYADDPRSIHHAAGLPIGDSDEWKEWVDFGDDDAPSARVVDGDMPF